MHHQVKTFRVFVSSTFTDMKEERSILQKQVFPKLEKLCKSKGARFQAVDLRWGVTEESQLNQQTIQICLNEIERCQSISPKPNFLILLGDKYGWQPIPEKIPLHEWKQFLPYIVQDNISLLNKWYKKDENAIPAEYLLQARKEEFEEYANWEPIENKLREIIRSAANKSSLSKAEKIKYFASATHLEILKGALNNDVADQNNHALAFIRNCAALPKNKTAKGFIDLYQGKQDEFSKNQLDNLKSDIKDKLGENCINYSANWNSSGIEISNSDSFSMTMYNKFKSIIEEELDSIELLSELDNERLLHKEFKSKLLHNFQGRKNTLRTISSYANEENKLDKTALTLSGPSGSGKSSILAKAIEECLTKNGHYVICYRFLGTTSASSNALYFLQSLCDEIVKNFQKEVSEFINNNEDINNLSGISSVFHKILKLACLGRPIVLFIDALDQLSDDKQSIVSWIPKELPPYVKIICSSLPSFDKHLSFTLQKALCPLETEEAKWILNAWLTNANRQLNEHQYSYIINKYADSGLAIYLKLAFEKAKNWTSFQNEFKLKETIEGIIGDFFDQLEKEFPKLFVENVICYLLSGKYLGLTENELLEILAHDTAFWTAFSNQSHEEHRDELKEIRKIPQSVWTRLYFKLEPFLSERDANGVPILTFFHRQFNEILLKKYGHDSHTHNLTRASRYHQNLTNYYKKQTHFYNDKGFHANIRKCSEIIFQAKHCKNHQLVKELLCDILFLQAKCNTGLIYEIKADFNTASDLIANDIQLSYFRAFYQQHIGWIKQNPTILFHQLFNDLQWLDETKSNAEVAKLEFLNRGGKFLHQILEPKIKIDYNRTVISDGKILCVSSDKSILLFLDQKKSEIHLWDVKNEQDIFHIPNVQNVAHSSPYFSENSKYLALKYKGSPDDIPRFSVWNIQEQIEILKFSSDNYQSNFANKDNLLFIKKIKRDNPKEIESALWDLENCSEMPIHSTSGKSCESVYFSPKEIYIASCVGSIDKEENTCEIWDNKTSKLISTIELDSAVKNLNWQTDNYLLIKTKKDIYLHNVTLKKTHFYNNCSTYAISPDGKKFACNNQNGQIDVFNFASEVKLGTLVNHSASANLLFTKDSKKLITSSNQYLLIWNVNSFKTKDGEILLLYNNKEVITDFHPIENEQKIITIGTSEAKIWDISKTGHFQNPGHEMSKTKRLYAHQLANNYWGYSNEGVVIIEDRNKKMPRFSYEPRAYALKQFKSLSGKEHFISFTDITKSSIWIWKADTLQNREIDIKQVNSEEITDRWDISPDGRYFVRVFRSDKRYFHLMDIETAETIFCVEISKNTFDEMPKNPFHFFNDDRYVSVSFPPQEKCIFDIQTKLEVNISAQNDSISDMINPAMLVPDSKQFAFDSANGILNFKNSSFSYFYTSSLKECILLHDSVKFVILTSNGEILVLEPNGL